MVISRFLIIPPAIVALVLFLWTYYRSNSMRLLEPHFALAILCCLVVIAPMAVEVMHVDPAWPSYFLCAAAFALLGLAIVLRRLNALDLRSPGR
jgi:hypothetical protein